MHVTNPTKQQQLIDINLIIHHIQSEEKLDAETIESYYILLGKVRMKAQELFDTTFDKIDKKNLYSRDNTPINSETPRLIANMQKILDRDLEVLAAMKILKPDLKTERTTEYEDYSQFFDFPKDLEVKSEP